MFDVLIELLMNLELFNLVDLGLQIISIAQLAGAVKYTDCSPAGEKEPLPPMSVLDMTLNNLMVRFCGKDGLDHQKATWQWLKYMNCQEHLADSRFCDA